MKTVKLLEYEDLTEEEKEYQPNNGGGKEYASYILIEDEKGRRIYSDAMKEKMLHFLEI
ncbi:hypothetical protein LCGC14_3107060 [marine sediment metagenome]|uniref:Uncharacterized protein n=1 Tax=marine sediment metagenome TaxID=412755 RepID=A0A0F8WUY0_9ZZZZ